MPWLQRADCDVVERRRMVHLELESMKQDRHWQLKLAAARNGLALCGLAKGTIIMLFCLTAGEGKTLE